MFYCDPLFLLKSLAVCCLVDFSKQAISPVSFRVHVLTCPPWFQCQSIFQGCCSSIRLAHEGSSQEPVLTALSFSTLSPGCLEHVPTCAHIRAVPLSPLHAAELPFQLPLSPPLCFPPTLSSSQQPLFGLVVGNLRFRVSLCAVRASHDWVRSRATWRERKGVADTTWILQSSLSTETPFTFPSGSREGFHSVPYLAS